MVVDGAKDILASRVAMGVTSLTIDDLNRPFYSCLKDGTLHLTFSLLSIVIPDEVYTTGSQPYFSYPFPIPLHIIINSSE